MSAGPAAERTLGDTFRRLIATDGPITVARFMGEANARYYASRDPLGTAGDFVTAPEVSQMFGELIGLWLADVWDRAGRPARVHYVELGPGRGTLARDALRAMATAGLAPGIHFVEGSPALARMQLDRVPAAQVHDTLADVPRDAPILLVANEFLDALPVSQLVRTAQGWRERLIAADGGGRFEFVAGDRPMDAAISHTASEGSIVETSPAAAALTGEIASRLAAQGGAALIIDYGYTQPRLGSSLQAVARHRKVDPFAEPGEADLTAHVDFAAAAQVAQARGARWLGTVPQGAWLKAMGIELRAAKLAQAPGQRESVEQALTRLTSPAEMGDLFKVMGLAAPGWPAGVGF